MITLRQGVAPRLSGIDVWDGASGASRDAPRFGLKSNSVSNARKQVRSNKDASKKILFQKMVLKFCFKILCRLLQSRNNVYRGVKEQCLIISMAFSDEFRDSKKTRDGPRTDQRTDGPTDGQTLI